MMRDLIERFARVWMLIARLPLPSWMMPRDVRMPDGTDMELFSIAGAVLALIATLPAYALSHVLPARLCAWIATAVYVAAGWSIHLDGAGDVCDGFGSGRRGDAMRDVMKDSRVGGFAVCGMIVCVAMRTEAIAALPPAAWPLACMFAGGVGRFAACVAAMFGTYPWGLGGISASIVEGVGAREVLCAGATTLPLALAAPTYWAPCLAVSFAIGAGLSAISERAIGGTNGDFMGAASVLGEIASLAALSAAVM